MYALPPPTSPSALKLINPLSFLNPVPPPSRLLTSRQRNDPGVHSPLSVPSPWPGIHLPSMRFSPNGGALGPAGALKDRGVSCGWPEETGVPIGAPARTHERWHRPTDLFHKNKTRDMASVRVWHRKRTCRTDRRVDTPTEPDNRGARSDRGSRYRAMRT